MRYWHTIQQAMNTKPRKILEIGIGNGTVSSHLTNMGYDVTTADFDSALNPSVVCSVTELHKHFKAKSFDTVICSQVLEHLKYVDFPIALSEIKTVCRNFLVLTLPQNALTFSFECSLPLIRKIGFVKAISLSRSKPQVGKTHYWELGMKGYSFSKVHGEIKKFFNILDCYTIPEKPNNKLYLLKPVS